MKKLFAILLSFTILALASLTVFAEVQSTNSSNQSPITENDIALGDVSPMSETSGITNYTIYNIKNVGSGKYLNVHYGTDANGTNVYQWTKDGSTEQKFKVVYSSATDTYKLYAMCSSSGNNRVVDIARNGAALAHGQNVNIWTPIDDTAQNFKIIALGQNQFRISTASNRNMYLAAYGNSNGTSGGTTATSAGNVYLSSYVGEMYQHWMFEPVETVTPSSHVWPTVSKRVTQLFNPPTHYGIDIGAVTPGVAGDEIYCFSNGLVTRSNGPFSSSYGNVAYINHYNPNQGISTYLQTRYAHMLNAPIPSVNTNVSTGQVIGYMGNTGQSNGVHLHFETKIANSLSEVNVLHKDSISPLYYFDSTNLILPYSDTDIATENGKIFVDYYLDINNIETEPNVAEYYNSIESTQ